MDQNKINAALRASKTGDHKALVEIILNGLDIESTNIFDKTILAMASEWGNTDLLEFLIMSGAKIDGSEKAKSTPLIDASREGHSSVVELLLRHKANVNATNYYKCTPLEQAVSNSIGAENDEVLDEYIKTMNYLMEFKADPFMKSCSEETALMGAKDRRLFRVVSPEKHDEVVRKLEEHEKAMKAEKEAKEEAEKQAKIAAKK